MPRISMTSMMKEEEVFLLLRSLKASMYYGLPIAQIHDVINVSEGYRYLTELNVLNEKAKSNLDDISEKNSV